MLDKFKSDFLLFIFFDFRPPDPPPSFSGFLFISKRTLRAGGCNSQTIDTCFLKSLNLIFFFYFFKAILAIMGYFVF
jgi:hypothetical protein